MKFNLKSDKGSEFEIKCENLSNKLSVYATNLYDIPQRSYKKLLTLEEVKENKYFGFCDNINEVINELTEINNSKLIEENNKIILYIPLNTKKIKEFIISIEEIIKSDENKFEELYNIINELKTENNNLKSKVQTLEENYNKKLKEIQILKESNEHFKNTIKPLHVRTNIITNEQYQTLKKMD